eukprot:5766930-Prymnesium_polylepis.1
MTIYTQMSAATKKSDPNHKYSRKPPMGWRQAGARGLMRGTGDYPLVLSTTPTCTSCQRHRRARVALDTTLRRTIGHSHGTVQR